MLIATPEFNGSIPGVLKNALDWASRPFPDNALRGMPVAVVGASTGLFGAVWAQAEVRKVLETIGAYVIDHELPVGQAHVAFGDDGHLTDAGHARRPRRARRRAGQPGRGPRRRWRRRVRYVGPPPVSLPLATAPLPERERADARRNRERILCAAARLVDERGIEGGVDGRRRRRRGRGQGAAPYRRFGDRWTLLRALIEEPERDFQDELIRGDAAARPRRAADGAPARLRRRAARAARAPRPLHVRRRQGDRGSPRRTRSTPSIARTWASCCARSSATTPRHRVPR